MRRERGRSVLKSFFLPVSDTYHVCKLLKSHFSMRFDRTWIAKIMISFLIQLFIYLFAPLCNHLKDIDFKTNLRLENGLKVWSAMYECRHPDATCFTAHCRAKPRIYWSQSFKSAKHHLLSDDVFVGGSESTLFN